MMSHLDDMLLKRLIVGKPTCNGLQSKPRGLELTQPFRLTLFATQNPARLTFNANGLTCS